MRVSRNESVPKYELGDLLGSTPTGALVSGGVQGLLGLGQSIFGMAQRRKANRELKRLKNDPRRLVHVPAAIRERANAPIAAEFLQQAEQNAARRTSQGVDALSRAGSRGIVAGLGNLVDQERMAERERMGQYEQERRGAMGELGRAEERVQDKNLAMYEADIAGARNEKMAGQQNVWGGAGQLGRGLGYIADKGAFDGLFKKGGSRGVAGGKGITPPVTPVSSPQQAQNNAVLPIPRLNWDIPLDPRIDPRLRGTRQGDGLQTDEEFEIEVGDLADPTNGRGYERGGKLPGKFSHEENPMHIVTDSGKKVGEATGGEVILNPEQTKTIEKMAKAGDKKLHSYVTSLWAKFKKKS